MASHLIYNINKHSMLPANVTATAIKRKKGRFGLYYIVELLLQSREQYVEINGKRSDHHKVKYGVPQGSLLDLRLFNIHVFDLPEVPSKG